MPANLDRAREVLIVALDFSSRAAALKIVEELSGSVGAFKVGLQLFSECGPELVRHLVKQGHSIFLDLKLHDIPNTVAGAAVAGARLGVKMMTLHTLGGEKMLKQARQAVDEFCRKENRVPPLLLGVTVLTSMDQDQLSSLGVETPLSRLALRLAKLAKHSGLDGIVCSPLEVEEFRRARLGRLRIVAPGIRPAGFKADDQARVLTAGEAVRSGADYLVVGRPVTRAENPVQVVRALVSEIRHAKMSAQ